MAPKSKDTPSSIRIRENQRRSRTRRRELITDLQNRVQQYEAEGVAATQQMQRAARKVVQENLRLRSLLARYGASQDEVDSYLRSFDDHEATIGNASSDIPASYVDGGGMTRRGAPKSIPNSTYSTARTPYNTHHAEQRFHDDRGIVEPQIERTHEEESTERQPYLRESSNRSPLPAESSTPRLSDNLTDTGDRSGADNAVHPFPVAEPPDCPNTVTCFCAPTTGTGSQPSSSGLEISCETAATIIIEMNRDGDRDSVRASLGCVGDGECKVKNSTVMQLMDER